MSAFVFNDWVYDILSSCNIVIINYTIHFLCLLSSTVNEYYFACYVSLNTAESALFFISRTQYVLMGDYV